MFRFPAASFAMIALGAALLPYTFAGLPSDQPEPSYEQAVARWPDMLHPIAFLGCKDHLDEFAVMWNGNISKLTSRLTTADQRIVSNGRQHSLQISFSLGPSPDFSRRTIDDNSSQASLRAGYLPMTEVRLLSGGAEVIQEAFATNPQGGAKAGKWDDPVFLRVRFRVVRSEGNQPVVLWAQFSANHTRYAMDTRRNVRISRVAPEYPGGLASKGQSLVDSTGKTVAFSSLPFDFHAELPQQLDSYFLADSRLDRNLARFSLPGLPGSSLELIIPFLPAAQAELDALVQVRFDENLGSVDAFWNGEIRRGMQVETPDPEVNRLWNYSVPLSFITADLYPNGDRVLKTSSHQYEAYWPTPTAMNLQELIQRGYREEVAQFLAPFLDPERSRPVPNTGSSFLSTKGFISGPSEHLAISWVSDHGAILWAASQYYLLTRDEAFLKRWLPLMLNGVNWIAREREQSKLRGHEGAGLMPEGRATDAEGQANYVWSDAWVFRGLDSVCQLLRSIGHPEAARWERERDDYRATFQKTFRSALEGTVRWKDSEGKEIPFVPYELQQKESNRHPFYLDTGPMFLGVAGLVPAADESMTWAMRWLTEGPETGKYNPEYSAFSEAPSLPYEMSSGEPCYSWNIPLRFLRNEKQEFLQGFYSLCAGAVSRRFLAGYETRDGIAGLPAMNAVICNHLRNMLVYENFAESGLELLRNSPARWLEPGKSVRVENAETYFGPLSYNVTSTDKGALLKIECPTRNPVRWLRIHAERSGAVYPRKASVNGASVEVGRDGIIELRSPVRSLEVHLEF